MAKWWLGSVVVSALDLWSTGRKLDSRSCTGWVTVCGWVAKPSRYETNHLGQLSLLSLWAK